jgi:hypothetical protein
MGKYTFAREQTIHYFKRSIEMGAKYTRKTKKQTKKCIEQFYITLGKEEVVKLDKFFINPNFKGTKAPYLI